MSPRPSWPCSKTTSSRVRTWSSTGARTSSISRFPEATNLRLATTRLLGLAPMNCRAYVSLRPRGKRSRGQEQGRKAVDPLPRGDPSGSLLFLGKNLWPPRYAAPDHERRAASPKAGWAPTADRDRGVDPHALPQRGGDAGC